MPSPTRCKTYPEAQEAFNVTPPVAGGHAVLIWVNAAPLPRSPADRTWPALEIGLGN